MRLHYNKSAQSYTAAITFEEFGSIFDVSIFQKGNPTEEEAYELQQSILSLNGFFGFVIKEVTGEEAPEFTHFLVQVGNGYIFYQMHTKMDEEDCRFGAPISKNLNFQEEVVKYTTDIMIAAVHEIAEAVEGMDEDSVIDDEYQLLFEDISDVIAFVKAIPAAIAEKMESSLIRVRDGLSLTIMVHATLAELQALQLDALSAEWNGKEINQIYEDFEPFDMENPVKELREL